MVRNLGQWPLKRGLIAKIRPSDACGRNTVLFARERWYNLLGLKVIWGMSAESSIHKIWNSEVYKNLRQAMKNGTWRDNPVCKICLDDLLHN